MEDESKTPAPFGIDAESINRYMAEQIAASLLGERLREAIAGVIEEVGRSSTVGYGKVNPMVSVVREEMMRLTREYLARPETQEVFRAAVVAALTPERLAYLTDQVEIAFRRD